MDNQICLENCRRLNELSVQVAEEVGFNEQEHVNINHRLDVLEENGKRQNEILITLQKQADAIESINGKIDNVVDSVNNMSGRIAEIEKEPGEKWKKISFEIVKYIVIAAIGAFGAYLFGGKI